MTGFQCDFRFYILLAVLIFFVPLPWLTSWIIAVCFHELCHLAVVKLLHGTVYSFKAGVSGANMECNNLSDRGYLLSILAGPLGGLVLVLTGRLFPRLAICSWILSVYNLMPVLPLDGGQALRLLIKNNDLFHIAERIALLLIFAFAIYLFFFANFGPLPFIAALSLFVKNRKRPCKEPHWGVQ